MQKLEDVAIHMKDKLDFLTKKDHKNLDFLQRTSATHIFDEKIINYLNDLSKAIFSDSRSKQYPDVTTFAFFCRRANIKSISKKYKNNTCRMIGHGILFHIAPSNVPVNFAYSLVAGLLSGNINIVRVPSKNFDQVQIIADAINEIEKTNKEIAKKIILVRYSNDNKSITKRFSELCNVRLIWGGDNTINSIRKEPLQPRSFDVTFSDRYSICIINADEFINESNPSSIAKGFYNDTYLFDQNACTSPHLIIWKGSNKNVKVSQEIFWSELHKLVQNKYKFQTIQAVDKITTFYNHSIAGSDIKNLKNTDNTLWRIKLNKLEKNIEEFRSNSGYFLEYQISSLKNLTPIINNKYQTMSYYGFSEDFLTDFIENDTPQGIDRIVPIGKTMDFSMIWDGYDLIETLSRKIEII